MKIIKMITFKKHLSYFAVALLILFLSFESGFAHSWMAPEKEAKRINPTPESRESIEKGTELFKERCLYCHGIDGKGLKKEETGLSKDTPNLSKRLSTHSDGDFHWEILNGKGDMPSFKSEISTDDVWHIINHIKTSNK